MRNTRATALAACVLACAGVVAAAVPATTAASAVHPAGTSDERTADWPQPYHGPRHRGVNFVETVLSPTTVGGLRVAWAYKPAGSFVTFDPIVANGTVFAEFDGPSGGSLVALDAQTGAVRWTRTGDFFITPSLVHGRLFVSEGFPASALDALDPATGATLWSTKLSSSPAFTVSADVIYAATTGSNDRIAALDARTGRVLWRFASNAAPGATTPTVANGRVYFGQFSDSPKPAIYALDAATGALIWRRDGLKLGLFDSFSSDHGVLYAATWSNREIAIDAKTGDLRWTRLENSLVRTVPAVDNGTVIVGTDNGQVIARNAHNGHLQWRFTPGVQIRGSVAIANGVAYVQSADQSTYALDAATGKKLWSAATGLNPGGGSPVVSNGWLYASGSALTAYHLPG